MKRMAGPHETHRPGATALGRFGLCRWPQEGAMTDRDPRTVAEHGEANENRNLTSHDCPWGEGTSYITSINLYYYINS